MATSIVDGVTHLSQVTPAAPAPPACAYYFAVDDSVQGLLADLNNGKRFSTYTIPGTAGSREICPNGGAALLCEPGDLLIIYAYETCDRQEILIKGHQARVMVADAENNIAEFYLQNLVPQGDRLEFQNLIAE
jgi:aspartate 1-decarboxylase